MGFDSQLILKVGRAQSKLQSLGVFSEVATVVDTSKGDDATPDGYDVLSMLFLFILC